MAFLVLVMVLLGHRVFAALRRAGPWLMRVTAVLFIGTGAFLFGYFAQNFGASLAQAPMTSATPAATGQTYHLTEGTDATGCPYKPRTFVIPARQTVQVTITDHIGGCLLRPVFEGLGLNGRAAEVGVPVGETRTVSLYVPHPGNYSFHGGENMYSGTVTAR